MGVVLVGLEVLHPAPASQVQAAPLEAQAEGLCDRCPADVQVAAPGEFVFRDAVVLCILRVVSCGSEAGYSPLRVFVQAERALVRPGGEPPRALGEGGRTLPVLHPLRWVVPRPGAQPQPVLVIDHQQQHVPGVRLEAAGWDELLGGGRRPGVDLGFQRTIRIHPHGETAVFTPPAPLSTPNPICLGCEEARNCTRAVFTDPAVPANP